MNRLTTVPIWILALVLFHGVLIGINIMGLLSPDAVPLANVLRVGYLVFASAYLTWIFVQCHSHSIEG